MPLFAIIALDTAQCRAERVVEAFKLPMRSGREAYTSLRVSG